MHFATAYYKENIERSDGGVEGFYLMGEIPQKVHLSIQKKIKEGSSSHFWEMDMQILWRKMIKIALIGDWKKKKTQTFEICK